MENFKNFIEYSSIVISGIMLVKLTLNQLKIFQQSHYHLDSFKKAFVYYYFKDPSNFLWPLIILLFFLNLYYVQIIYSVFLLILLVMKFQQKDIIKLKITFRIKRLGLSILIIKTIFASAVLLLINLPELMSALAILMLLSPFLVLISSVIMHPIEMLISKYYQFKAKMKLRKVNTSIIGITGSYGKTSTKNILFSILKDKYITLATEKSFNTLNGVSKNINELLGSHHQMMIVEMGATRVNDIQKLVSLVKPKYGIVTSVGPQHLESFKTIDNILNEKMKLIDSLPNDGVGIINGDNEYIRNYQIKSKCKIVTFGISKNCDYQAYDIKANLEGIEFSIRFNKESIKLKTSLLGNHNVYNILASFALAKELKVKMKEIIYQVSTLEPVKNRLNVEVNNGYTIIDDAFNSNSVGFKNALEVLNYYQNPKILITPGIVEAGIEEEKINYELADEIQKVCDYVVLVKTRSSLSINKGLDDLNYEKKVVVESFKKAMQFVKEKYQTATILIENDVSDIYKI